MSSRFVKPVQLSGRTGWLRIKQGVKIIKGTLASECAHFIKDPIG